MYTRRKFIKQAAVTSGGLLLSAPVWSNIFPVEKPKVIIIGAGLAGPTAAYRLKQKKIDYLILESRSRIGGRVFSHQITDDLVIELGGEWIGNSHIRMQQLCNEFDLELQNNQLDTHLIYKGKYMPSGNWSYSEEWNRQFTKILADYEHFSEDDKQLLDGMDWWRFLIGKGCDGRDLDIRELLDSTDFGEGIRHVSAFAALTEYAESSEKNEMDLKIKGGNSVLADKLSEVIGKENIMLEHSVQKVVQNTKVHVYCANGKVFEADKVICTIPTFALQNINWEPALPKMKTDALLQLQYARINKHALLFEKRFWQEESFDMVTDQTPHYFYHATKNQPSENGVLISYSIGDKAAVIANQDDNRNAAEIERTLQPHFGNIRSLLKKQVNYYWGNDNYSKGAYALFSREQWFRLRPTLQEPFLHTYFAGEHLADWQGFMEGAVNTGEDAADSI
jgi:monoamine oxidase